jgi:hypothetical protein
LTPAPKSELGVAKSGHGHPGTEKPIKISMQTCR